jgi:hypothetical protein
MPKINAGTTKRPKKFNGKIKRIKEIFQAQFESLTTTADTDYSPWKATKRVRHGSSG